MGSVSASTLIIFIAAIGVAAGVSGVMIDTIGGLSNSITTQGEDVQQQLETEISIISDEGSDTIHDGSAVRVLVKNTGSRALSADASRIDVLVNGEYIRPDSRSVEIVSGGDTWQRGEVIELTVDLNGSLDSGEQRVAVIVDGDQEVLRFYV